MTIRVIKYAGIYLLQNYSTCFGCNRTHHQEQKTVTAASGTGHGIRATTFRQRGLGHAGERLLP